MQNFPLAIPKSSLYNEGDLISEMAIQEIRVRETTIDTTGIDALTKAQRITSHIKDVQTAKLYRLEGTQEEQADLLAQKLFCEPLTQTYALNTTLFNDTPHVVEVAYKPGVMNPQVDSIMEGAADLGVMIAAADMSTEYAFYGDITRETVDEIVERFLMNETVEQVVYKAPETLLITGDVGPVELIELRDKSDDELVALSTERQLHLNLDEMQVIRNYATLIGRELTDCEVEAIAGRWSEHCFHKTFKAEILANGERKAPLFSRIKDTARQYFGDLVISAFEDNAGVIRFYDDMALVGKVETHNSPSAIEPYGGAATGSGGVFRDIMGTGQGAKVISSTDMFCFAPPDLDPSLLPQGTLPPDYLLENVVAGVRDYGNRMGIPTNNGSVHFDPDFRAKPTVIVGAYGMIEEERAKKGKPEIDDLVVVIGGRTGRDGIHGATFSSGEMTDKTIVVNATSVQIGNPIEEKRMHDAIVEARKSGLIRAITDCGAAGFSSAIGEMGEDIGVTVDISKAPLKYSGLAPWEIWMSESQERMILAISLENHDKFQEICTRYDVEETVLGNFDGSHRLIVNYGEQNVVDLDYEFLQHGLPQREMKAVYKKQVFEERIPDMPTDWSQTLKDVLSHGNVCSKEPIVRQYDHTVQGTNVLQPFSGVDFDGPNDAVVTTPILGKDYGMVQAHGMNPVLNRIDPYWGSIWASTEAMANYVAVGGNPDEAHLINNYIWPFPDEESLGSLDKSVDAVVDFMKALKISVISGKDSLAATFRGSDGTVIKIPPVLCMSVFGRIPDVKKTVTSDLKNTESTLVLIGKIDEAMGGSTYYDINGIVGNEVPKVDLEVLPDVLRGMHQAIQTGDVLSCHDVSEGGIIGAISEMAFGSDLGVELTLDADMKRTDLFLFNETAGCFVAEVKDEKTAEKLFQNVPYTILGKTNERKSITVKKGANEDLFEANVTELKKAWKAPMQPIFS